MSFIPEGYFEAQAVFEGPGPGGPRMVVTGHTQNELASPDEEAQLVAENLWGASDSLLEAMDSNYALIQVNVYANQGGLDLLVGQWNGNLPGSVGGEANAPQVAVLIQKQTSFAGRRNRGRMYVPGVATASTNEDGTIDPGPLATWQLGADTWLNESQAHGIDLVILHAQPGLPPVPVEHLSVQQTLATQRRRLR